MFLRLRLFGSHSIWTIVFVIVFVALPLKSTTTTTTMTGGLRISPNQKGARLNAFDPYVADESDYYHESSLRHPGTTDELTNTNLQEPPLPGGVHQPPVDAFEPFFVLDPDNYFFGSSSGGLRGGRQSLAGSHSGPGSLSASTEDNEVMLISVCLSIAVGVLAIILYKQSGNESKAKNAQRESTVLEEEDEWIVYRE
jgi:hypothetical protein